MVKIEVDEGYSFGLGVFETIKVVDGRAMFLEKHWKRMKRGMDFLGITSTLSLQEIEEYIESQTEKYFACKVMISSKNVLFETREDPYRNRIENGWSLKISRRLRNSTSALVQHKTLCYAENILEYRQAKKEGYDEVVFFNEQGYITEGSITNLFFVQGEEIYTASLSQGILAGTIREYLFEHYSVKEMAITLEDLGKFEACFVTNALMGISWVVSIESFDYRKTKFLEKLLLDMKKLGF